MRNLNRYLYILAIGLGVSCAPRPKLVYVDLASLTETPAPAPNPSPKHSLPPGIAGETAELGALPKRTVSFPVSGDPLEEARAIVAKSEQDAVREIARRLVKTYLNEVDDLEAEHTRKLDPSLKARAETAFADIRSLFETYAQKRGPLLVKLAARSGWPDPDPDSLRVPDDSNKRRLQSFLIAKGLREQIKDLDARYDADVKKLIADYEADNRQTLAGMKIAIEELRSKKLEQAEAEARKQVESAREKIHSLVVGDPSVTLESVPQKEVAFPSASPKVLSPSVRSVDSSAGEEIRADLQIWLAQNRFQLAKKGAARDATEDFKQWRNIRLNGR